MAILHKVDETKASLEATDEEMAALMPAFTFYAKGYRHHPLYKKHVWDGKIRQVKRDGDTWLGLTDRIEAECKRQGIPFRKNFESFGDPNFSSEECHKYLLTLGLPFDAHEHQADAVVEAVSRGRGVLVSPTASGKSLISYALFAYFREPTLLIVPRASLVKQMAEHFQEYGCDGDDIHQICGGASREFSKKIVISTWQSVYKQPKEWYRPFRVVVGDEAHLFSAKSLAQVMENLRRCPNRFGLTGSLDGDEGNECLLEGLFGPVVVITDAKTLMDKGLIARLKIKVIRLKYGKDDARQTLKKVVRKDRSWTRPDYRTEVDFLAAHEGRRRFVARLASCLDGNTMSLFDMVEKDGILLHEYVQEEALKRGKRPFLVHGGIKVEDRESVRAYAKHHDDAVMDASYGTFSTGIDIPTIRHVIMASPAGYSRVRVLQTMGRAMRLAEGKDHAFAYDIADDLSSANPECYSMRHLTERLKLYAEQGFDYTIQEVTI